MKIRWEGDNLKSIEQMLERYGTVRYHDASRRSLRLVAKEFSAQGGAVEQLQDVELVVELGDIVHYRRGTDGMTDSIGIERPPDPGDDGEITWTGENPFDVVMFIRKHDLSISRAGDDLILKEGGAARRAQERNAEIRRVASILSSKDEYIRMRRGDKLILQRGCLFLSRVGVEHRA